MKELIALVVLMLTVIAYMVGYNDGSNNKDKFLREHGVEYHLIDCPIPSCSYGSKTPEAP